MITFVTCFYKVKSKFNVDVYKKWIHNFLSIVNDFNLVIYTNLESYPIFEEYEDIIKKNERIRFVYKEFSEFHNFKYKDNWIHNQKNNNLLSYVDWKLLMLWSEKIFFVDDAKNNNYFPSDFYVWCDIGYFRNRINDTPIYHLKEFPKKDKINLLDTNKIYYGCVIDNFYLSRLIDHIKLGRKIPDNQISIAGGFFIIHRDKLDWWKETFDQKVKLYFQNQLLIKDDQIIIVHCIAEHIDHFELIKEKDKYDNWFMFQRWLN
jgi:hypothetical protein